MLGIPIVACCSIHIFHIRNISYELESKLLVCPIISPILVPYLLSKKNPFKEFRQ